MADVVVPDPAPAVPPVAIRRAVVEDWERCRSLRLQALQETPLAFASTYQHEVALAPEEWRRRITTAAQFLAVDAADAVLGTATGFVDPKDPQTVHLVAMHVVPEARRRGVGLRLVAAVAEHARAIGALRVRLHVVETNAAAARLYDRCGFLRTGATMRLPHRPELLEHEMELSLADRVGPAN